MVEQQEFQIPQQLRELAEKSVEQARLAYGQFLDGMAEALRAWSTVPSAASGFKVVQEQAIQSAKENSMFPLNMHPDKDPCLFLEKGRRPKLTPLRVVGLTR